MRSIKSAGFIALAFTVAAVACTEDATGPDTAMTPVVAASHTADDLAGNGFPKGGHDYHLNIIGVPRDKTADMDGNQGHRIFVQLESDNVVEEPGGKNNQLAKKGAGGEQNQIWLCNSSADEHDAQDQRCDDWRAAHPGEFGVIDANATNDDGGMFGLPDPCDDDSSLTACTPTYEIYARARTPQGSAIITTCAEEDQAYDGNKDTWCGSNGIELTKQADRKAIDVTDNLLFMSISVADTEDELLNCIEGTVDVDYDAGPYDYDVYLFDRCFENYFWNYDNNGLKNLELRFYFREVA